MTNTFDRYVQQMDELRDSLVLRRMIVYCIHQHGLPPELTRQQVKHALTKKHLPTALEELVCTRRVDDRVRFYDEGTVVFRHGKSLVRIEVDGSITVVGDHYMPSALHRALAQET